MGVAGRMMGIGAVAVGGMLAYLSFSFKDPGMGIVGTVICLIGLGKALGG